MPHPEIDNHSPFVFASLHVSDEDGRPLLVLAVKATYDIRNDSVVERAEEQLSLKLSGEAWGKPGQSSFKYEPEACWVKPATDVVLVAHAWAPRHNTRILDIAFGVGPVAKKARVFGERKWLALKAPEASTPEPFETLPLVYERAFGGWDRSHADPMKHTFDERNPFGRGFLAKGGCVDGLALPNIEDPLAPMRTPADKPAPVGFGFSCAQWQPRAVFAGTYDEAWSAERAPLLPENFDRRFLNGASTGLVAPGYLRGDEPVIGTGVTKSGRLAFKLPGQAPPVFRVRLRSRDDEAPPAHLDTVIVNTDDNKLILIWRAEVVLDGGPHDVLSIGVDAPTSPRESAE